MSASKQKGTAWETAVTRFLQENGVPHAERRALAGNGDRGDIAGIPGVAIECKSASRVELAAWTDEAEKERANDNARHGAVWIKRRGKTSPGDGFVILTGHGLLRLLTDAGYIQASEPSRLNVIADILGADPADLDELPALVDGLVTSNRALRNQLDQALAEVSRLRPPTHLDAASVLRDARVVADEDELAREVAALRWAPPDLVDRRKPVDLNLSVGPPKAAQESSGDSSDGRWAEIMRMVDGLPEVAAEAVCEAYSLGVARGVERAAPTGIEKAAAARLAGSAVERVQAALVDAWPELGRDPVYVNQLAEEAVRAIVGVAL